MRTNSKNKSLPFVVQNLTVVILHPAGEEEDEEDDEDDIEGGTKRAAEDDDDDEEVGQQNPDFMLENQYEQSGDLIISHLLLPLPPQDVETKKQKTDDDD